MATAGEFLDRADGDAKAVRLLELGLEIHRTGRRVNVRKAERMAPDETFVPKSEALTNVLSAGLVLAALMEAT